MPNKDPYILLVDDDPLIRRMFRQALEGAGYRVDVARDGREALRLLDSMSEKPALVLLDVIMPELNGLEVLRGIKEDAQLKNIPVAMLTSLSGKESEGERAIGLGATCYIIKGKDSLADFVNSVESLLRDTREK